MGRKDEVEETGNNNELAHTCKVDRSHAISLSEDTEAPLKTFALMSIGISTQ